MYTNERNKIKGSIVEGMMAAFVGRYQLAMAVSEVKPGFVPSNQRMHDEYIQERSLHSKRKPGAMDYYAVAMTTMIALYSALPGSALLRGSGRGRRLTAFWLLLFAKARFLLESWSGTSRRIFFVLRSSCCSANGCFMPIGGIT
ncbi:hypothetical protein LR69_01713 [Geobacillus sp. BCO2]|nr:hypothetical protein LR69_01713 [Geobacillus sp. BCO2]